MAKILTVFLFVIGGFAVVIIAIVAFATMQLKHIIGTDEQSAAAVAQNIGRFAVPSGFEEHNHHFNLPQSSVLEGGFTTVVFQSKDNSNMILSLESLPRDIAQGKENEKAAFVKKASRFCVRYDTLEDDQAVVYGKPLVLHQISCVLRNHQTEIMEGASFAKLHSAGKENISVYASGPESIWDSESVHALLASLH